MKPVVRSLKRDIRRMVTVPAAWIVIVGLLFVPALYAWFNIVGFWDPYSNTGKIRVAVANEDQGATKDIIGFINVGATVENQLRANDQLGWYFVSADQAQKDVERGHAYAAIVIPSDFSQKLTGIVDGTYSKPNVQYYVNERNNAIAPKITGAGASSLDQQINSTFVSTVAQTLSAKISSTGRSISGILQGNRSDLKDKITAARDQLGEAEQTLKGMDGRIDAAKEKISGARNSLNSADSSLSDLNSALSQADQLVNDTRSTLSTFSTNMSGALDGLANHATDATAKASAAGGAFNGGVQGATTTINGLLTEGQSINQTNGDILRQLQNLGIAQLPTASQALQDLSTQNSQVGQTLANLSTLNGSLATTSNSITQALATLQNSSQALSNSAAQARSGIGDQLPAISNALDQMSSASANLRSAIAVLQGQREQMNGLLDQLTALLDSTKTTLAQSATNVSALMNDLGSAQGDISAISSSNAIQSLSGSMNLNPEKIAEFMAAPTSIHTQAVFPVATYGSAMAPLFTNLALWIGAFSLVVILKLEVDDEEVGPMSSVQRYMSRWMLLALFALGQAVVVSIGDLIIGIQTVSKLAFVGTAMISSLAYLSIIYMLATCFQHIGKGLCVVIVMLQIPGSAGLYPIEMMPSFFRFLYPLFPFTYGINAMRETVGGFYGHAYLRAIGVLAIHVAISFTIGLALRPYLVNLNTMVTRDLSRSGLFISEATRLPSSRFRLSQIVSVLADHDSYSRSVSRRVRTFERRYPRMRRAALVLGIVVPALLAVLSVTSATEVPIMLGLWIVWILAIIAFLIAVEFVRESLERQQLLTNMNDSDVRSLLQRRAHGAAALFASAVKKSASVRDEEAAEEGGEK
ncbi:YhgE/Pip domain-containing protein [uncultured Actinomyces sp.]|uniref:YhgE/Pip domain-containing protein n=1 Tax=uncultured Actinomyces sp. TaxID=249061 RepID=UPI0015B791FD|nr:YhgE/Pip domain-containing protein [uncultured Actinomyces sp.]